MTQRPKGQDCRDFYRYSNTSTWLESTLRRKYKEKRFKMKAAGPTSPIGKHLTTRLNKCLEKFLREEIKAQETRADSVC